MVLTGVGGEQGAGLAVDDLLDDGHLHGGWHHAQALHHGVHWGDARHHPKVWVEIWRGRSATDWLLKTKQLCGLWAKQHNKKSLFIYCQDMSRAHAKPVTLHFTSSLFLSFPVQIVCQLQ